MRDPNKFLSPEHFWFGHLHDALSPAVVLQLLDRLEAAEVWDYGTRVGLHNDLSYAEGTVVGYDLHRRRYKVEVDGYGRTEWVPRSQLRPLPPLSAAVPGAVAGEPESTPAAEPLPESQHGGVVCPRPTHAVLIEGADDPYCGRCGWLVDLHADTTPYPEPAWTRARHSRAADTQEAHDA